MDKLNCVRAWKLIFNIKKGKLHRMIEKLNLHREKGAIFYQI